METSLLKQILDQLQEIEQVAATAPELMTQLEAQYEKLAATCAGSAEFLSRRNQFRVRYAAAMKIRRPRVLYGSRRRLVNFHAIPLLQMADVMFVSVEQGHQPWADLVCADPFDDDMSTIVRALPSGFNPDLYFDYQVCAIDRCIRGLEQAPFPTVATLCHHFRALKCEQIAKQFDYVLPLSSKFCEILGHHIAPEKIIDLPFGLSWGSFHHTISTEPQEPRKIDVALTFSAGGGPEYGPYRTIISELFDAAAAKLSGRYRFERITGATRSAYLDSLGTSRIVLNAVGFHGPYNYRTCEAINAGAVLMQYDAHYATGPQGMEKYLVPGEDFVAFDKSDFIAKLERLLADPEGCVAMARRAQTKLVQKYAYGRQYKALFETVAAKSGWRERRPAKERAALSRVLEYIQMPGDTQILAALDIGDASKASGLHPAAFLMPLYRSFAAIVEPQVIEEIVGAIGDIPDISKRCLAVYEAAIAAIPNPSVVDRFNYLVLCAQEGKLLPDACRQLQQDILLAPEVTREEAARIVSPKVSGIEASLAEQAWVAILNIGTLLATDDASRQQAVRDFMVLWCCWLQDVAGASTEATREVPVRILQKYKVCEDDVPVCCLKMDRRLDAEVSAAPVSQVR